MFNVCLFETKILIQLAEDDVQVYLMFDKIVFNPSLEKRHIYVNGRFLQSDVRNTYLDY